MYRMSSFFTPAWSAAICSAFSCPIPPPDAGAAPALTAMPAASTSAMLAEKYGRDYKFASELIMTSTILSLFTIPVVATALEWIF